MPFPIVIDFPFTLDGFFEWFCPLQRTFDQPGFHLGQGGGESQFHDLKSRSLVFGHAGIDTLIAIFKSCDELVHVLCAVYPGYRRRYLDIVHLAAVAYVGYLAHAGLVPGQPQVERREDRLVYEAMVGSLGAKGGGMTLFGKPRGRRGLFWEVLF